MTSFECDAISLRTRKRYPFSSWSKELIFRIGMDMGTNDDQCKEFAEAIPSTGISPNATADSSV